VTGAQLLVIAKRPVPGRVKTRLTPPYTPEDAAGLARAALRDTLLAVRRTPAVRRVVALDGPPGPYVPAGFGVVRQRGAGLDERLAHAFADAYAGCPAPMLLIGMDTPQVTPALLTGAATALESADAVLGPAEDGGFWLLGLRRPDPGLLLGVPMSTPGTGAAQHERLRAAGLDVAVAPALRDVDTAADVRAVAARIPGSHFAAAQARLAQDRLSVPEPTA